MQKWRKQQKNHELIIGLVHQVGTDHTPVIPWLKELMGSCSFEPYPKSKALEFHQEAVTLDKSDGENKVIFEPFTGIGPRKFFDLFSMNMSSGYPLSRKEKGKNAVWTRKNAVFRLPTASISYFELEKLTANILTKVME